MKVKIETTMTDYQTFLKSKERILEIAQSIMDTKQPEYTNGDPDVLHNFKSISDIMKVPTEQIWATYFFKHVQSIMTHAGDPELIPVEPLESRFADAINYLFLGYALLCENNKFPKDIVHYFPENDDIYNKESL